MSRNFPKFRICAIVDGEQRGLLAKKQRADGSKIEIAYFYLKDGLKPTDEILRACNGNAKCLYTADYREEHIFNEIVSYAENVVRSGKKGPFEFIQKHHESRGYQEVVDRYYADDRKSPFKHFFESAATLKNNVLRNVRGKHHLAEGRAEEFTVLSPHQMMVDDFEYLEPIGDVLKIGVTSQRKRLEKAGPIAADFDDDRVYRRAKLLADLKNLVLEKSVSMLIGESGTGKTVLARQLAYEFHMKDRYAVYYFDCGLNRDFKPVKLLKEINSVRGIFVLENIHLATQEFQRIYDRVEEDSNRHVLLIARPSFRETQTSKDVELGEIESIELIPFDGVDKIIDHYVSRHAELSLSAEEREAIKNVSRKSFWLLCYALEGYIKAGGKGEPRAWLEKGVTDDLNELEKLDPKFPEVVVALSPLYQHEVLTEELFLTKNLGFYPDTLQKLVWRGEITRQQTKDGYTFYGLPHSALADAYWEYGRTYRRRRELPEYEDFIYWYATSDVPNGLQAVVLAPSGTTQRLLKRLDTAQRMVHVVRREGSLGAITTFLEAYCWQQDDISDELARILAKRIQESERLLGMPYFFLSTLSIFKKGGRRTWCFFDQRQLADRLIKSNDTREVSLFIRAVRCAGDDLASRFYKLLDLDGLGRHWRGRLEDICNMANCVGTIARVCPNMRQELLEQIDREEVAAKLNATKDLRLLCLCIQLILEMDEGVYREVFSSLDLSKLARRLSAVQDVAWSAIFIMGILAYCPETGRQLCKQPELRPSVDWLKKMIRSHFSRLSISEVVHSGSENGGIFYEILNL